jgi:hypothetical protein
VGQHLRHRGRGHPSVDLDLVGHGRALGRRRRPVAVPAGAVAGLGLVTWTVLGSWLVLGWRTVAVEAAGPEPAGAVDSQRHLARRSATLPTGGPGASPGGAGVPAGDPTGEVAGTSPSRGSVSVPK